MLRPIWALWPEWHTAAGRVPAIPNTLTEPQASCGSYPWSGVWTTFTRSRRRRRRMAQGGGTRPCSPVRGCRNRDQWNGHISRRRGRRLGWLPRQQAPRACCSHADSETGHVRTGRRLGWVTQGSRPKDGNVRPVASELRSAPRRDALPGAAPRPIPSLSPTSSNDCGGDEPRIPCPGSGVPYHLRLGGRVGRSLLCSPQRGNRGLPYSPQSGNGDLRIPPRGSSGHLAVNTC